LKKSNQKTFCLIWTALVSRPKAQISKSFLLLFFKKEVLAYFLSPGVPHAAQAAR